jgi:hypothetical protein
MKQGEIITEIEKGEFIEGEITPTPNNFKIS